MMIWITILLIELGILAVKILPIVAIITSTILIYRGYVQFSSSVLDDIDQREYEEDMQESSFVDEGHGK